MPYISPIDQQSRIVDTVYEKLCDAIFHHEIAAGSRLSVPELAVEFGVSRSPVKEAVQQLVTDGVAEAYPRRGVFVSEFNIDDVVNILEIRTPLEGFAGRQAAERITDAGVAKLESILANQEKAINRNYGPAYAKSDSAFHSEIAAATENERLQHILRILHNQMRLSWRFMSYTPINLKASFNDHLKIFEAIQARNPAKAEQQLIAHTIKSKERLTKQVHHREKGT